MKRMIFAIIIAIILATFVTSCETTNNGEIKRSKTEVQEDLNNDTIYFVENDLPKFEKYINEDSSLSLRDKQPVKRRIRTLKVDVEEFKQLNQE